MEENETFGIVCLLNKVRIDHFLNLIANILHFVNNLVLVSFNGVQVLVVLLVIRN